MKIKAGLGVGHQGLLSPLEPGLLCILYLVNDLDERTETRFSGADSLVGQDKN